MKQLFTIFLTMVFCFCLSAEDKQNAKKNYIKSNAQALKSYTWYDGNTEKTAWMLTDVVAEFGNSSLVKSFDKSASVSASYGAVQIWKLGDLTQKESIARSNSGSFSPVYTNNSNGDGTKMALTGKIVVFLKPGVDGAKWASDNNLKIVQKMNFGNGIVVLSTATESIALANSLRSNPNVESSQPDWWIETSPR